MTFITLWKCPILLNFKQPNRNSDIRKGELVMKRYDELTQIQLDLLQNGIIDLVGEVDFEMLKYVREALMRLLAKPICQPLKLLISSDGGSVKEGLSIYDAIKSYPAPTVGIVCRAADSMAAIILQACDTRRCMEHATVLIHNPNIRRLT
jgi:ATP-dependent Clp protease protease subunit